MKAKYPYIALHSAGSDNIKTTERILEILNDEEVWKQYEYSYEQDYPKSTSLCPRFDLYIRKKQ